MLASRQSIESHTAFCGRGPRPPAAAPARAAIGLDSASTPAVARATTPPQRDGPGNGDTPCKATVEWDIPTFERRHAGHHVSQSSVTPQTAPPRLHFRVPPEPSHLLRARERLRDYLRQYCASPEVIDDLVLCVEEACTNAIRHSGAGDDIEIALAFEAERLVAQVRDRGRGFDTASFDPARHPDPSADHGRGLFIIAALMDSLELRLDGGLEVRMARAAPARCEPQPLETGLGEPRSTATIGQREARTRAMLEEIDEAFIALDWEYRYVYANRRACRLLGKSRQELLGQTPFALFEALRDSKLERGFRAAMELGTPTVMEWHSPLIGVWIETRIYPTPAGVVSYFRDISERKQIELEHAQALLRTTLLKEIAAAAADTVDLEDLARTTLEATRRLLGATTGNLFVIDEQKGVLRSLAHAGIPQEALHLYGEVPLDSDTASTRVALSGSLVTHDTDGLPDMTRRVQEVTGVAGSGWVIIPIRVRGKTTGTLGLSFGTARPFTEDELGFYQSVADQLGVGIEKARLSEAAREAQLQAQRELERTGLLQRVTAAATSTLSLDEIGRRVLALAMRALGASGGVIYAVDEAEGELRALALAGYTEERASQIQVVPIDDQFTVGYLVSHDLPLIAFDSAVIAPSSAEHARQLREEGTRWIVLPVKRGDTIFGVFGLTFAGERPFDEDELSLYRSIAELLGSAFQNVRSFEALRANEIEYRLLAENASDVVWVLDLESSRFRYMSPSVERLRGYTAQEVLSQDTSAALTVDSAEHLARVLPVRLAEFQGGVERVYIDEIEQPCKDGSTVRTETSTRFAVDPHTGRLEVYGASRDITARKQAELERERLVVELQDRSAALHERSASLARRVALDESLERVNRLIYSTLEFDEIMERALDEATDALGADAGSIEMREQGTWSVRYQRGFALPSGPLRLSDAEAPIATRAALSKEPLAVEDLLVETETDVAYLRGQQLRSTLAVPLIVHGSVVGCLLFHGRAPRVFTAPELDFAKKLGSSVSLALENVRLSEREAEAGRLDESVTWSRSTRLARRLRAHPWRVLVGAIAIESAILAALGAIGDTRRVLGVPGSMVALIAVDRRGCGRSGRRRARRRRRRCRVLRDGRRLRQQVLSLDNGDLDGDLGDGRSGVGLSCQRPARAG